MYSSLLTDGPADAASCRLTSPLIGSCIVQSSESPLGVVEVHVIVHVFNNNIFVPTLSCHKLGIYFIISGIMQIILNTANLLNYQ